MANLNQCHEALGLTTGASLEEVKQAYKDLVNVWHPDRFAHNPRIQKKAEEKLKQINAAYGELISFLEKSGSSRSGFNHKAEPPREPPPEPPSEPPPQQDQSYDRRPKSNQNINKTSPTLVVVGFGILVFFLFLYLADVMTSQRTRSLSPPLASGTSQAIPLPPSPAPPTKLASPITEQTINRNPTLVPHGPSTESVPKKLANVTPSQKKESVSIDNDHPSALPPKKSVSKEKPDFTGLSSQEKDSADAACRSAYHKGPAEYNVCLNRQVNQLKR